MFPKGGKRQQGQTDGDRQERTEVEGETVPNRQHSVHTETAEERETVRGELSVSDRGETVDK